MKTEQENPDRQEAATILRERAQSLAQPAPTRSGEERFLETLQFTLAREKYALETRYLNGVYPLEDLTPLPGLPDFVQGIVYLRGRVIPVFDLKRLFELPGEGIADIHQVILVRSSDCEFGLLVDTILGVHPVAKGSLQEFSAAALGSPRSSYQRGVTPEGVVFLDMERLLQDPRIEMNDEVAV